MERLERREFMKLAGAGLAGLMAAPMAGRALGGEAPARPNIVFILTDDQGWGDLACFGHRRVKTPNLDRLAREGTRLTNFYANSPVCSPSRVAFTSGRYPARCGVDYALGGHEHNQNLQQADYLDPALPTLPRILKEAGYTTAHFGKFHIADTWHPQRNPDAIPVDAYGFDHWACAGHQGPQLWRTDLGEVRRSDNSSEVIINRSIEFIDEVAPQGPFYVNVWLMDPHSILDPNEEQMAGYEDVGMRDNLRDRTPGAMQIYYSVITELDKQVGRLLDKLDEAGLTDKTIVFFTSDNGPSPIWGRDTAHSGAGLTGPFRGVKASIYEGGIRMPCIVRWPGHTPAGVVNDTTVMAAVNLVPTMATIAGAPVPAGIDGIAMPQVFEGKPRPRPEPIFWEYRFGPWGRHIQRCLRYAMREGDWKIMTNHDGSEAELYNLAKDPSETSNCAEYEPERVARMSPVLLAWARTLPSWEKPDHEAARKYPWPKSGDLGE